MENTDQQDTFNLIETSKNLLRNWWKIALMGIVFGLVGLGVSYIKPPKYEASAIFSATIDYRDINFENLVGEGGAPLEFTQYDVDMALSAVQRILFNTWKRAYSHAKELDPGLSAETFNQDFLIERLHDRWTLKFRHKDPEIAQSTVNFWANLSMRRLDQEQSKGSIEPYVIVDLISDAYLPEKPIYHNRNILALSGTLIGLLAGIIIFDFSYRTIHKKSKAA